MLKYLYLFLKYVCVNVYVCLNTLTSPLTVIMIEPNTETVITSMSKQAFWNSIQILLTKPHVINKRIWGCKQMFQWSGEPLSNKWFMPLYCDDFKDNNKDNYRTVVFKEFKIKDSDNSKPAADILELVLLELLPKSFSLQHAFQLVCLNKNENMAVFYNVTPNKCSQTICPDFTYSLQLLDNNLILKSVCDNTSKTYKWLASNFLNQFVKWGESCDAPRHNICSDSLSLVSNEKYYQKYNELKLKYGKGMVKIWPECTDPNKFVYEDVAIATYLLVLWESQEQDTKKTFVDLGCGNGLLVYILSKEGHKGVGIDVRKRQIWDLYPKDVVLEAKTIVPSDANLFPETDWIIGNHSDELTPWIPVIAARSSYKCNFFLLPCCAYNFDGTKYQRRDSSKSQYTEYLEYIKELCETCGFKTDIDRLKIPSTKRICLVGRSRTHDLEDYVMYCSNIKDLILTETQSTHSDADEQSWVKDFKPREAIERVRNCTQVDKSIIQSIVDSVTTYLLEAIDVNGDWDAGKSVDINKIVDLLPQGKLNALKSECGGLQTLLKNNHHIFQVQRGLIQLRYPKTIEEVTKSTKNKRNYLKVQQKPCWFYNNHPQGCPLTSSNCSFLHTKLK